jgi:fucose 4-O-acetylase-like acetyltransferase
MSLVPHRRSWLSDMGASTLVVYLIHGFPIRYADFEDWARWLPASPALSLLIVVSLAVGLALLIAWPPVAGRLNYLVDPVNSLVKFPFRARTPAR